MRISVCEINLDVSWLVGYIANIICMGLAFLFDLPAVGSKETLSLARLNHMKKQVGNSQN